MTGIGTVVSLVTLITFWYTIKTGLVPVGDSGMMINPFQTNGISHNNTYNKVRMVHCIY